MLPAEFTLIQNFTPLAAPAALGLADDAAILTPPSNQDLVISTDAIVQGIHFLENDPPDLVARKLLRVNLSDLAAMGATPLHYLLTISVPRTTPAAWFETFAKGLAQDQAEFNITLIGGDTTSTPGPISLSATVIGHITPGTALRRTGAQPGDEIWVTGTIGDAALGLLALRNEIPDPTGHLANRYLLPRPRLGLPLHTLVHAAMDISDGLIQDTAHLASAAALGAEIEAALVPLSPAARAANRLPLCLTGGDDYELLMAVAPVRGEALRAACATAGVPACRIGSFIPGQAVSVLAPDGTALPLDEHGWSHF
jgi:thiamine-monophosphate kinase